jgi:hypothetical protein
VQRRKRVCAVGAVAGVALSVLSTLGPTLAPASSGAAVTSPHVSAPSGLPLYEFSRTGTVNLPWVASSLVKLTGGATMSAGPRTVERAGVDIVAFATATHDVSFLSTGATATSYLDLTSLLGLASAADAPVPFFDALGRLNVVYVASNAHVFLVTNTPLSATAVLSHPIGFVHREWVVHDLSTLSISANRPNGFLGTGQLDATVSGTNELIALRTPAGELICFSVSAQRPVLLNSVALIATAVSSTPTFVGPLSDHVANVAAVSTNGHLVIYRNLTANTWTSLDLTGQLKLPLLTRFVAGAKTASLIYLAGVSQATGSVWLATGTLAKSVLAWTSVNVTSATANNAAPGPALAGQLAVTLTPTYVSIAGRAADWGNLFEYANNGAKAAWLASDVSAAGGVNARTVGTQVAAVDPGGKVNYFAGAVSSPATPGVGIYDVPSANLNHVISDGWPIIGVTGGLGTSGAPWVQTTATANIPFSADFQTGKVIQSSAKRTTWLSFWTVSGPSASESVAPATYQAHGFAAGAAVAKQIDQYASFGLNLKPDWVILDPEGYPDLHSQMDGIDIAKIKGTAGTVTVTTASSTPLTTGTKITLAYTGKGALNVSNVPIIVTSPHTFTIANSFAGTLLGTGKVLNQTLMRAWWAATLTGWRSGIASVDPSLNPGIYTEMSQYTSMDIANQPMPVFMAIAWGGGGPIAIAHSANVLGFIEFGNLCTSGSVQTQLKMFAAPPWNALYNTVQFNPPGYCNPHTP